jgi:hypothetical protein
MAFFLHGQVVRSVCRCGLLQATLKSPRAGGRNDEDDEDEVPARKLVGKLWDFNGFLMVLMEFLWDFWKPLGKNDEKGLAVCFHPDSLEQTPTILGLFTLPQSQSLHFGSQ